MWTSSHCRHAAHAARAVHTAYCAGERACGDAWPCRAAQQWCGAIYPVPGLLGLVLGPFRALMASYEQPMTNCRRPAVFRSLLQRQFEAFGPVISTRIILDRDTRQPKGFGFVNMAGAWLIGAAQIGFDHCL